MMGKVEAKRHSSNNLVRRQGLREIKQSFLIVCEGVCIGFIQLSAGSSAAGNKKCRGDSF